MKRILFLSLVVSFCVSDLYAQQQSSRRTRQIAPRVARNTSAAETLQQQAEQVEKTNASPFENYEDEPGAVEPVLRAPQPSIPAAESSVFSRLEIASEDEPTAQLNAPAFVGQPPTTTNEINQLSHRSISTQIIAPAEINVGEKTEIRLIATNTGQQDIGSFNLVLHLPSGVEFTQSRPAVVNRAGDMAAWRIDGLAAGLNTEVTFEVVPQTKQPVLLRTELTYIDRQQLEIAVRQPQVKMTVQTVEKAIVGQSIEHRLTIWNEGDGTADELQLQLALPAEMQMIDGAGNSITVGTLAPGESREITLHTRSANPGMQPLNWNLAGQSVNIEVASQVAVIWPELYAELLGPKMNIPNRDGTYTINLNNPCEIAINETSVSLQIPDGMEITLLSREGQLDEKQRTITWSIGTLAPGSSESLQFKARLTGNQDQKCQVIVQSLETESNLLALETKAYIHTELKLAMKNNSGPVNVGDTVEFVIVASNTGHVDATGVDIQVEIPEWLSLAEDSSYAIDRQNSRLIFQSVDIPKGMAASSTSPARVATPATTWYEVSSTTKARLSP